MRLFILLSLILVPGCFVESRGGGETELHFFVSWPQKAALSTNTLYVEACLDAEDLPEPLCAETTLDGGAQSTTLSLTAPSGDQRSLVLVAFLSDDQGEIQSYSSFTQGVTLTPGTMELPLTLSETPTFDLEGTLTGTTLPESLTPVDVLTGIEFPPVSVDEEGSFLIEGLPTGRFFYLLPEGSGTPYRFCPVYSSVGGTIQKTIDLTEETC